AAGLGRLPTGAVVVGVLAAPGRPAARSLPLPAGRGRLGRRAAGAVMPSSAEPGLRDLMRRFPHGVAVLTVDAEGERLGLTVGSLLSLSLEPPLVGVAIDRQAGVAGGVRGGGG